MAGTAFWRQATLDRYLSDPRAAVPGTKMEYAGVKNEEQRKDVIAYLAALHLAVVLSAEVSCNRRPEHVLDISDAKSRA